MVKRDHSRGHRVEWRLGLLIGVAAFCASGCSPRPQPRSVFSQDTEMVFEELGRQARVQHFPRQRLSQEFVSGQPIFADSGLPFTSTRSFETRHQSDNSEGLFFVLFVFGALLVLVWLVHTVARSRNLDAIRTSFAQRSSDPDADRREAPTDEEPPHRRDAARRADPPPPRRLQSSAEVASTRVRNVVVHCRQCGGENEPDAKFCQACGKGMAKTKACSDCRELNASDANFCSQCGRVLSRAG